MKRIASCFAVIVLVCCVFLSEIARADGTVLKEKKLRDAVQSFILDRTRDSGLEIKIKRITIGGDIAVPAGTVDYEFIAPSQWQGWGKTLLGLVIRVDGQLVRNMSIPVEVEALAELVVALHPMPRNAVIEESDVSLQKRDLGTSSAKVCFSLSDVVGKRVRVPLRANTPIRSDYLERVPLVKYGQFVTIVVESGELRVTATGVARGKGAEGDLVMVQNVSSKKMVQGRVVDEGTVAVNF